MNKGYTNIDGKFYEKCEVVLRSTVNKSNILLCIQSLKSLRPCDDEWGKRGDIVENFSIGSFYFGNSEKCNFKYFQPEHIYILSNNTITEGDWVYSTVSGDIYLFQKSDNSKSFEIINKFKELYKKIIATSDSSFKLPICSNGFIEKFCQLGGIKEVMVEYIMSYEDSLEGDEFVPRPAGYILKTSPDNTITIKPVKDSWNKKDLSIFKNISNQNHIKFIYERLKNVHNEDANTDYMIKLKGISDWIDENF